MKVLVTGALGNIGAHTVEMLLQKGHEVTCYDRKSFQQQQVAKRFKKRANIVWGDIRNLQEITPILHEQDVIVHLAAILPPATELNPTLASDVNVNGTQQLIKILESAPKSPFLIFASSNSVHGIHADKSTVVKASDPLQATDAYSSQKIECEKLIRNSQLNWVILRISAAIPLSVTQINPLLFKISLDTRIEFTHPADSALAIANCIGNKAVYGKTFLIGGGPSCQMLYKDMVQQLLDCVGVGMFPESAFTTKPYYVDWMDTTESQALLHYQQHNFTDLLNDLNQLMGWRKPFVKLFRPLIRQQLLRLSK